MFTSRADGDLRVDGPADELEQRRRDVVDLPWTWLRQIHGARTVVVDAPGQHAGAEADAAVTATAGAALAIGVADCAPVALVSPQGIVGAVHAGWRGLEAGVVDEAVAAMRSLGARAIDAYVGPCIHPECYEFGEDDLSRLERRFGPAVRGRTREGRPALDLGAAVDAALGIAGVRAALPAGPCTACDADRWFSHRARQDTGRQALVVWIDP